MIQIVILMMVYNMIFNIKKNITISLMFILMFFNAFEVSAKHASSNLVKNTILAQEFNYDAHARIVANCGKKSQTRISFPPYTIREIVGDSNKYKLINDQRGASIYILPKVGAGEKINITLITTGGKSQDLSLNVVEGEGSLIILKQHHLGLSDAKDNQHQDYAYLNRAKAMLKAMTKGSKGKYDLTEVKKIIATIKNSNGNGLLRNLEVREDKLYRHREDELKGVALTIRNKTNSLANISEQDISSMFKNTLLTTISSNVISPKSCTRAFVIMSDKALQQ